MIYLSKEFKKFARIRGISENIFIILLQYIGTTLSLAYINFPCFFAAGTALAFTFLRGFSILPGIAIGTFIAFYSISHDLIHSILFSILFTLQNFLIVKICYQQQIFIPVFVSIKHFLKFCVIVFLITLINSLLLIKFHFGMNFWFNQLSGIFIVAISIAYWDYYFPAFSTFTKNAFKTSK